ncbi:uncharacterized protein LOC8072089 [Sorghum bicolor]|uniref:Uncharacterized protein n=1 Tax=Sorghum bicolor TaxID=4558 RepID=A0A1B6Q654_SORBI|nr:uncharacterized protein LOC8072089 [Sorghum bicolor]KXG33401.1 hypothetical protein SORBI_3003G300000 [Sorghum bicolor]|eukprot:XP_002458512.2 uncharacterized protein LOC8072089 [Sorghum bicolor]
MRHLKRGGGGADPHDAAVLNFVGLGEFAQLYLPDHPPGELGLSAAYDDASGRIMVSVRGGAVSASPASLAGALGLSMGPVGLPAGWDAAVFCTSEAIGAVKGFVCDRVLLGWGGSGAAVSMEVAAALRLVEEGKAYDVDWGGLIWAVVKREVVAGTPWRYAPYLLHLMVCQRPELFAESLPLGKRFKDQVLQQCQLEDEEASLVFLGTQSVGDLEEMPIFGSQNISFFPQPQEVGGNCSHQTISHFQALMQQIQGYVSNMNSKYLDKEQICRDAQHEVECIKAMVKEKENQIAATVNAIEQELLARRVVMRKFEVDKDELCRSVQHYRKLLKKTSAQFQEHRNMVTRGEGVDSYLEHLGISGGQNLSWMRQMRSQYQMFETCDSKSSKLLKDFTEMERSIASLNHEVERLKNCRAIPDLNNGVEDDGEGKASLATTLGASWTREGDCVSNTTQGGRQVVVLIPNPDKRNDTRESMDLDGAQSGTKLC